MQSDAFENKLPSIFFLPLFRLKDLAHCQHSGSKCCVSSTAVTQPSISLSCETSSRLKLAFKVLARNWFDFHQFYLFLQYKQEGVYIYKYTARQKRKPWVFNLICFCFLTFLHLEKLTFKIVCQSSQSHLIRFSAAYTLGEKTIIWKVRPNSDLTGLTSDIRCSESCLGKGNQSQAYCLAENFLSFTQHI